MHLPRFRVGVDRVARTGDRILWCGSRHKSVDPRTRPRRSRLAVHRPCIRLRLGHLGVHAVTVDFHLPDDDAYGRVTNPGRYQEVVDATRIMIDELVATYEVESTAGIPNVDFPDSQGPATDVVRLHPREGAPLAFMFTDFPGVVVHAGELCVQAFPACGCDACDESPTEVIERLERLVRAVVEGRYAEELTKRTLSYSLAGEWGSSSSEERLQRGEWSRHGSLGPRQWPSWTKR